MSSYPMRPIGRKSLANLTKAIERDLLAERPRAAPTPECFACSRACTPKPPTGDDSTRFCSDRCREAYDAGCPPHDPRYHTKGNQLWYRLPLGREGFLIDCAGCGKRFDSSGLRCCSPPASASLASAGRSTASRLRLASSSCRNSAPSARAKNAGATSRAGATAARCRVPPASAPRNAAPKPGSAPDSPPADLPRETRKKCP